MSLWHHSGGMMTSCGRFSEEIEEVMRKEDMSQESLWEKKGNVRKEKRKVGDIMWKKTIGENCNIPQLSDIPHTWRLVLSHDLIPYPYSNFGNSFWCRCLILGYLGWIGVLYFLEPVSIVRLVIYTGPTCGHTFLHIQRGSLQCSDSVGHILKTDSSC